MADEEKPKADRCEDCGNTGLRADAETGTAICDCPVGRRRERAFDGFDL